MPESFARDLGIGMPAQITSNGTGYAGGIAAVSPEVVNGMKSPRACAADGKKLARPGCARTSGCRCASSWTPNQRRADGGARPVRVEQDGGNFAYVVDSGSMCAASQTGAASLDAVEIVSGLTRATASSSPAPTSSTTRTASASPENDHARFPTTRAPALDRRKISPTPSAAPARSTCSTADATRGAASANGRAREPRIAHGYRATTRCWSRFGIR